LGPGLTAALAGMAGVFTLIALFALGVFAVTPTWAVVILVTCEWLSPMFVYDAMK
jgi:hypothetical protein